MPQMTNFLTVGLNSVSTHLGLDVKEGKAGPWEGRTKISEALPFPSFPAAGDECKAT